MILDVKQIMMDALSQQDVEITHRVNNSSNQRGKTINGGTNWFDSF